MKGVLINPKRGISEVDFKDNLEEFYNLLECQTIDILSVKVGNIFYDVICDDEALLKENPIPSIVDKNGSAIIFGSALLCKADNEGNQIGLTEGEIANILNHRKIGILGNSITYIVFGAGF